MDVAGKVAVVSGGASGLGRAAVERLVADGARVVLLDLEHSAGQQVAGCLGDRARFVAGDVRDEQAVQAGIDVAVGWGGPHVVVSCAGIGPPMRIVSRRGVHPLASFEHVVGVNLVGTFNVLRLAAAAMLDRDTEDEERGVIVNTASVAAFEGQVGQAAYAASKAGVAGLTLPAARDLAGARVRVMTIAPGLFATPLLAGLPQEAQDSLGQQTPHPRRLGRPEEYAELVAAIVSNPMLNGEVVRLDGAIRMAPR